MRSRVLIGAGTLAFFAAASFANGGVRAHAPEAGQTASGVIFRTLLNLANSDGEDPSAALVQGADGNFYGTTISGGPEKDGAVFRITPQGILTTIHYFHGTDGSDPQDALVLGTDGNFYGTTYSGGDVNACNGFGCGTLFRITPAGALTTLYSFCSQAACADGALPGGLVQGSDGNFYGTTYLGGSGACDGGCGTAFRITPNGMLTTLYNFSANGGGGTFPDPVGALVQGTDGNFYGTTDQGGTGTACYGGCGTVFKITPEGVPTTLHSFTGTGEEGWGPTGLIQATDGDFYGTTGAGGSSQTCPPNGCGTVFKMTPERAFTTIADLSYIDGSGPSGVIQAANGNFYGTAQQSGGACNCGTIFEVTPEGVLIRLHSFNHSGGGYFPFAGLIQATNGAFYGDTFYSNPGYGSIFSLSVGLGPFVKSVPTAGKTGTTVKILGNNLLFATGVTFNGVAASFTAESSTYIKATVPAGATTGPIVVTLPSGTLTSNVNFQVLP
ncbi:MAG TPA: choice-of-anchor tandem repeat GloVer-containing protein [Terriglobales bacterium]